MGGFFEGARVDSKCEEGLLIIRGFLQGILKGIDEKKLHEGNGSRNLINVDRRIGKINRKDCNELKAMKEVQKYEIVSKGT